MASTGILALTVYSGGKRSPLASAAAFFALYCSNCSRLVAASVGTGSGKYSSFLYLYLTCPLAPHSVLSSATNWRQENGAAVLVFL